MTERKIVKIGPDDARLHSPSLGHKFDVVCFDEATDFTKEQIDQAMAILDKGSLRVAGQRFYGATEAERLAKAEAWFKDQTEN